MKIITMFLLPFLLLLGACSFNLPPPSVSSLGSSISNKYAHLNFSAEEYVRYLNRRTLDYSWDSPSNINADDLVDICAFNNLLSLPVTPNDATIASGANYILNMAPAELVEAAVQKKFNVTSEHLRTSTRYQPIDNTYLLLSGWGGGWAYIATSSIQTDEQIEIEIAFISSDDNVPIPTGTLFLTVCEDNTIIYQSYKLK